MQAVRRFLTVAAITALGFLGVGFFASPAGAVAPEIIHLPEESGSEPGFVQCDGFAIDLAGTENVDFIVFRDQSGQVVRVMRRARIVETYTNTVTGKTVTNRGVFKDTNTRIDDTEQFRHTVVGFDFIATYPGEGLLLQSVGRKVFSIDGDELVFSAGQDNLPEGPEANALFCAALA
jgi:hypothetical protein